MIDPLREFEKEILPEPPVEEIPDAGRRAGTSATASVAGPKANDADRTPRESTADVANVAVVFVHGMGTSKPGDMLESYMNPALEWIKRATTDDHSWYKHNELDENLVEGVNILERSRRSGASPETRRVATRDTDGSTVEESHTITHEVDIGRLRNALLHSTETTPAIFQPPYVEADVNMREGDTLTTRKLVAVEAWWDGEFEAPSFRQVAQWALGVAPALILRHLALVWEKDPGADAHTLSVSSPSPDSRQSPRSKLSRVVPGLMFTFVGGVVAILFQWAICLLLMLGSVPFLQKYVSTIILKMTTSFGDVLTYVHDGVRSAAIRSTVLRAFMWLSQNYAVEKLIVVGHSLGSVISYDVLNSRDLVRRISVDEVSLVTFGSPLKKANLLLHLKRDEQRVSLGMLFATASFLCAVAALLVGTTGGDSAGFARGQWLIVVGVAISVAALSVGAHMKPTMITIPGTPLMLNLSAWQFLGVALGCVSSVVLMLEIESWWRLFALLPALGLIWWSRPVSVSRLMFIYDSSRMSQSLGFGVALLVLVAIAMVFSAIPLMASLLLFALVFSAMTGANPLEEFALGNGEYIRKMPKFGFDTPIRQWIDFWATNDLVSEFGLGDVRYRTNPDDPFDQSPISRRVTNMRSFIVDHTSYRQNLEQFIAPMTRLFLEQLGFRSPNDVAGQAQGAFDTLVGRTQISGNYEQDIANAMQTRASRVRWLSRAGGLLMLTMLLFSPGVYRSVGEFIVFDERNPVSLVGTGEPIEAPGWFTAFYNEQPKVCGEILCRIRHLPIVPNDVSEQLIRNSISGNTILFGLGYGVAFAIATIVSRVFLTIPWRSWESSILDTLLHKKIGFSFNRFVRGGAFCLACLTVLVFALAVNNPWYGLSWVWENELSPLQTVASLVGWVFTPLVG